MADADPWAQFRVTPSQDDPWAQFRVQQPAGADTAAAPEDVTAGMALRGIPILGAYVPQAEAAIRAAAHPLTGVGQPGATWAERYTANLPQREATYQQAEEESPWTSAALKMGGGMAALAPLGATAVGGRLLGMTSPTMAGRVGYGAASGAGISAADAAARGEDPYTAAGIGGALGGVGSAIARPTPTGRGGAVRAADVAALDEAGIPMTAGQRTGFKPLQYLEGSLGDITGAGTAAHEATREGFTRAAGEGAGITAGRITPEIFDQAIAENSARFNQVTSRNVLQGDRLLGEQLAKPLVKYADTAGAQGLDQSPAGRAFIKTIDLLDQHNSVLPGEAYQVLRSSLGEAARSSDPQSMKAIYAMQHALDDAMERSLRAAKSPDTGVFKQVRSQYRDLLAIENALGRGGEAAAQGILTPAALQRAVMQQGKRANLRGQRDLGELARQGVSALKDLPQSGTAPRSYMQSIPGILAGAGGGFMAGNVPGAVIGGLGGLVGPPLMGGALMSRPAQRWLSNRAPYMGIAPSLATTGYQTFGGQ